MSLYFQRMSNRLSLLVVLLCAMMGLAGLHPPAIRAEKPAIQPQRHYQAGQIPPGLTASAWRQIVTQIEQRPYYPAETEQPGYFKATNLAQNWRVNFAPTGLTVRPQAGGDWRWGLRLAQVGRIGALRSVNQPHLSAAGETVTYDWGEGLTELVHNRADGLKQDFILTERPAGAGSLRLELAVSGNLTGQPAGETINFYNQQGQLSLTYGGLIVYDATGQLLPAHFELTPTLSSIQNPKSKIQNPLLSLVIDDTAARYPLTIDPLAQQAYLKASNTGESYDFGRSVAVSGDTVVVGGPFEDSNAVGVNGNQADTSAPSAGAVYIFVRSGSTWSQQAYLKASNTGGGDNFGYAVAISGETVVVGAPWEGSNAVGVNGNQADNSAPFAGAAYVFTRSGNTWSQQTYLKASNTGMNDSFGRSVAISGNTVVVGASGEASSAVGVNGNQTDNSADAVGAAYVFTRSGNTWSQQAYLKASNTEAVDGFGVTVGVSGETVVVGAHSEDSNAVGVNGNQADNSASAAGAVYVFTRSGSTWSQQAYLKASNTDAEDQFGDAVAISGDTVVVGATGEDSRAVGVNGNQADNGAFTAGAAYVFTRNGNAWSQQAYLKASNTGSDGFGSAVAISGNTVVAGASGEASNAVGVNGNQADNSLPYAGAAYVFTRIGNIWSQQAYLKASNTEADDVFGWAVAVSGETVVVGAPWEDSNAVGVNGNQADNSLPYAGAAYIFLDTSAPEIAVLGNTVEITAGDTTPSLADHTDFGSVTLSGAITRTFTISNSGDAALSLTGSPVVSITGPAAGDFSLVSPPTTPVLSNTTTFQVRFDPTVMGTRTATLTIANDDNNENPYTFAIKGTGNNLAPLANAGPDQNTGGGLVTLDGSASSDPDGHLPLTYGWSQTGGLAVTLSSATASQPTFTVPVASLLLTFSLRVTDSFGLADSTPDQAQVTVMAPPPEIAILGNGQPISEGDTNPSPIDHTNFGSLSLGGAMTRTFTISNSGPGTLALIGGPVVSITGPAAGDFSLVTSPTALIEPGHSGAFQIRFSPSLAGIRTASLSLANNDSNEALYTFTIQGRGIANGGGFSAYLPLILKVGP